MQEELVLSMSFQKTDIITVLKSALLLPKAELCTINWENITPDLKEWISGLVDGDGCITADLKHGLRVLVKQAEHGFDSLFQLQSLLGGSIHDNKEETETWQAQKTWSISGNSARSFCREMESFLSLKRAQSSEALRYPLFELKAMQMQPLMATENTSGKQTLYGSSKEAKRKTGAANIYGSISHKIRSSGGYQWSKVDNPIITSDVKAQQQRVINNLQNLKRTEHTPMTELKHPGYYAGIIDSDGCIYVDSKGSRRYEVGQKYKAICDALKFEFGGEINQDKKGCYHWRISGAYGELFMQTVSPYLLSKRKQAELAMGKTAGDAINVRAQLRVLKNRRVRNQK